MKPSILQDFTKSIIIAQNEAILVTGGNTELAESFVDWDCNPKTCTINKCKNSCDNPNCTNGDCPTDQLCGQQPIDTKKCFITNTDPAKCNK